MFRFVVPHLRVESVLDLGVDRLGELGLDAVLLDVDSTLKSYRSETVAADVLAWLDALRAAGIGVCLLSNGRGRRIGQIAEGLGLPFVAKACKPLPFGCRRATRTMGFDRGRTAMVGDQLFADVIAGRLAGLFTVLVRPIRPEEEMWFTRMKRPFERLVLRWTGRKREGTQTREGL